MVEIMVWTSISNKKTGESKLYPPDYYEQRLHLNYKKTGIRYFKIG